MSASENRKGLGSRSYVSGTSDLPLIGMTIGDCLDAAASECPEREALVSCHQNLRYTYAELRDAADRVARALLALGIERGDRVGIWSLNGAEWALTQLATAKIGAILVNLNPSYRAHELEHALTQSGLSALVLQGAYRVGGTIKSHYVDILCELAPVLRDPPMSDQRPLAGARTLTCDTLPQLKHVVCLDDALATPGMWHWSDLHHLADSVPAERLAAQQAELQFDDPINIQYTSGTTGAPKGVTLTHHNILNNGYFVGGGMNLQPGERVVIPVPLYHCFGMVMGNLACLSHRATAIYPNDGFDPEATLRAVETERAQALYGVPTMFIAELEHPRFGDFDLSSLRTGIMAGSNCPIEVMKRVIERMHMEDVTIAYGMTETSPVSLQTRPDAPLAKRVATVGTIHPHLEVKIIDPASGRIVPRGVSGELCTRGYSVMLGYWNNDAATRQSIDPQGWMHTGDLAMMDDDGFVAITGRIKDMIIRGGENLYPREIEEFLYTHPGISDAQVFGVPDPKYGEAVAVWVRLVEGVELDEEAIRDYCRDRIDHHKIPRYVRFVDEFPMTVSGKIQKFRMRQATSEELGLE
ncbi:AMP-binding protein [Salinicola sp. MH3R3-1]|uniref:AMP-binding protein n=1 Tax=Salinicola sp. MH3R3-1 TaxID=1928762 RepID=UPI00094E1A78|nr:AMP-binding protein [Salinicola sp. MH3R3-1]OLO08767.1 AMP-binding protein [Salinicola sp. MH3R3-1]